jgi:hypothetical protein
MISSIAVITYRRLGPLRAFLQSIESVCPQYPLAVFEDCATYDGTAAFLMKDATPLGYDSEFDSDGYEHTSPSGRKWTAWLSKRNEGVVGGSNKALRWMERNKFDHLCLCNDDLLAKGDFPSVYLAAHQKLSVGLFTFCDLKNTARATYEGPTVPVKGLRVKILPRMVGMMMSVTSKLVYDSPEAIGYFDATFGRFGNEHCLSFDTPLITRNEGLIKLGDADGKWVEVWNGDSWTALKPRKTGSGRKLYRVTLSDGSYLDCTSEHRWSVTRRNKPNRWAPSRTDELTNAYRCEPTQLDGNFGKKRYPHAYTLGFAVGDGFVDNTTGKVIVPLNGNKDIQCPVAGTRFKYTRKGICKGAMVDSSRFVKARLVQTLKLDADALLPLFFWNRHSILSFIAGLADADGTHGGSKYGIRISISREDRVRRLQLLLTRVGIKSSIFLCGKKGSLTNFGPRGEDLWGLQITDCRNIPCHRLDTTRGRQPIKKGKYQVVRSVTELPGLHDTYCLTEPKNHKALFGNVLTHQCDYNNRARLMGFINLSNQAQLALDVETVTLSSQMSESGPIPSAILAFERGPLDARANADAARASRLYTYEHLYRPYRLPYPVYADAFGMPNQGIPTHELERLGYEMVMDRVT